MPREEDETEEGPQGVSPGEPSEEEKEDVEMVQQGEKRAAPSSWLEAAAQKMAKAAEETIACCRGLLVAVRGRGEKWLPAVTCEDEEERRVLQELEEEEFWDNLSGAWLDGERVLRARKKEIELFKVI